MGTLLHLQASREVGKKFRSSDKFVTLKREMPKEEGLEDRGGGGIQEHSTLTRRLKLNSLVIHGSGTVLHRGFRRFQEWVGIFMTPGRFCA